MVRTLSRFSLLVAGLALAAGWVRTLRIPTPAAAVALCRGASDGRPGPITGDSVDLTRLIHV